MIWYLIISTTLVLCTKFEIFKHSRFCWCSLWNVLQPPYLTLQSFNFTTLRRYLARLAWTVWYDKEPFFFSILILFTDNKWLDPLWDWYLIILATLVLFKFEMFKYSLFRSVSFETFWNFPIWICNLLMQYLLLQCKIYPKIGNVLLPDLYVHN